MTYKEICQYPQTFKKSDGTICHESLLKSFHIVDKLRWLMEQGTSNTVMLELLDFMEEEPPEPPTLAGRTP